MAATGHCHCTRCQRAHGAAFVTWVGFDEGAVSVQGAPEALRWFVTPEGAQRVGPAGRSGTGVKP